MRTPSLPPPHRPPGKSSTLLQHQCTACISAQLPLPISSRPLSRAQQSQPFGVLLALSSRASGVRSPFADEPGEAPRYLRYNLLSRSLATSSLFLLEDISLGHRIGRASTKALNPKPAIPYCNKVVGCTRLAVLLQPSSSPFPEL